MPTSESKRGRNFPVVDPESNYKHIGLLLPLVNYNVACEFPVSRATAIMPTPKKLLVEKHKGGEVYVIKMNKPNKMNCTCPEMGRMMCQAFDEFRVDPKTKVAILTGSGNKAFCAGGKTMRPSQCEIFSYRQPQVT